MPQETTSIHSINADKGLGRVGQLLYVSLNWLNNRLPNAFVAEDLKIQPFQPDRLSEVWPQLTPKSSPSRRLSDLLWLQLPWAKIKEELGDIHLVDTGCGAGDYGIKLQDFSQNGISSYTGFDTTEHSNWKSLSEDPCFQFKKIESEQILDAIPKETNFFVSQSAIEHFQNDLTYFRQIRYFIQTRKQPALQIHLFPSAMGLKLFGYHGIRQYTPRTTSKIVRLFSDFSSSVLFELGGQECNRVHIEYISKPLKKNQGDLRETKTSEYEEQVFKSIQEDLLTRHKIPAFYALMIHSYAKTNIFGANTPTT